MKANTCSQNNSFTESNRVIIWVFCLMFFIAIWQSLLYRNLPATKMDFAKWYDVDKKTFNKWIKYFCKNLYADLSEYQRKRKLSKKESKAIIAILGSPQFYPILSKKEIIKHCDSSYSVLRRCVYAFPERFGLTPTSFKTIQKFPPKISRRIMEQLDPDRVEWVLDKNRQSANGDDLTTSPKKS